MKLENLQKKLKKLKLEFKNNKILINDKDFITVHFFEKEVASCFELNDYNIYFDNFSQVLKYLLNANLLKK